MESTLLLFGIARELLNLHASGSVLMAPRKISGFHPLAYSLRVCHFSISYLLQRGKSLTFKRVHMHLIVRRVRIPKSMSLAAPADVGRYSQFLLTGLNNG